MNDLDSALRPTGTASGPPGRCDTDLFFAMRLDPLAPDLSAEDARLW